MRSLLAISRAMASSTSSPADGSPRQLTDSSMALWARCRAPSAATRRTPPSSWARKSPSQPCTELSRCFDTHSVSPSGSRSATGASRSSSSARSSARSRGSNSGRSWGRAPSAASTSAWAGLCSLPVLVHLRTTVTPPGLNGPSDPAVVLPPLRPGRPGPRRQAARALGLVVPGFRSPPRLVGVQRSIKRWHGGATVAVVVRGRPWPAVQADLIEGVVAANGLVPARLRPRPGRAVARPRGRPARGGGGRLTGDGTRRSADAVLAPAAARGGDQRGRRAGQLRRRVRRAARRRRPSPAPTTGRPPSARPTASTSRRAPTSCAAAPPTTCRSAATPCCASATASSTTSAATATSAASRHVVA